ncbi:MAG: glycosyltransferase family 4 protein [Actinobacteria bacterium]|nr:glycosyltransferase family 4 protein [Actinomycetota bacterium]
MAEPSPEHRRPALSHLLVDARPVNHPTAGQRGIGRYTLGLLAGLQQVGAPVVALYGTDTEAAILHGTVADLALQPWSPAVVRAHTQPGAWYLATQLMLHPIPLDPVPRIITDSGMPVAAVMYDVIPERYPERYQVRPQARVQVQLRGMLTRTLDALLAISDFAADTAADELRFPRDRIATIGAGFNPQFVLGVGDPWPRLRGVLQDDGRRVVVTVAGSNDPRKNIDRLLRAWDSLAPATRRAHRLVVVGEVVGGFPAQAAPDRDVHFTGSITDDQLVALNQVATLAVMPSIEEGFGLPVLEAAACGSAVITSSVSALPEILAEPAAQFDPYDVAAIAAAVELALTDAKHRGVLLAAGRRAVQRCTWANVASAVVDSLQQFGARRPRTLRPVPHRTAVVGRFDDSPVGRANTSRVRDMTPEVTLLVDSSDSPEPTRAGPRRFPAHALGHFLPTSQFDEVTTL